MAHEISNTGSLAIAVKVNITDAASTKQVPCMSPSLPLLRVPNHKNLVAHPCTFHSIKGAVLIDSEHYAVVAD